MFVVGSDGCVKVVPHPLQKLASHEPDGYGCSMGQQSLHAVSLDKSGSITFLQACCAVLQGCDPVTHLAVQNTWL